MIFHITSRAAWEAALGAGIYEADSLKTEGFIHCSTEGQLLEVARTFYSGRDDLILLTIDAALLEENSLVYEDLYDHGDLFPHIYGPLPTSAVVSTGPYRAHLS